MEINELLRIRALGNLFQYYHSDLTYILNFQRYKQNALSRSEYLSKSSGSFQSFLNEFKIARNVDKNMVGDLLDLTIEWVYSSKADDVDGFAANLKNKGLTYGKIVTSLASKVLFLNNPWVIFPSDKFNKMAVGIRTNKYYDFFNAVCEIMKKKTLHVEEDLHLVLQYLYTIENEFNGEIKDVDVIRQNRYADKLLWVSGLSKTASKQNRILKKS